MKQGCLEVLRDAVFWQQDMIRNAEAYGPMVVHRKAAANLGSKPGKMVSFGFGQVQVGFLEVN